MTPTPHSHWSHYDENLEMAQFDAIHAKFLSGDTKIQTETAKLISYAYSTGYADADNFLCETAGRPAEDPYTIAQKQQFDDYENGDYSYNIGLSQDLLRVAANDQCRALSDELCRAIRISYQQGRAEKLSSAPTAA